MFKKNLVPGIGDTLMAVSFDVEVYLVDSDENETLTTETTVTHYFKRPTAVQREQLAEAFSDFRGRGMKAKKAIAAIWKFWSVAVRKVAGYDDLGEVDFEKDVSWKNYFRDDIGMEHVQTACGFLLRRLGGEETEVIKK